MEKKCKCSDCKLATQLQNDLTYFFHNSKDLIYEVLRFNNMLQEE